MTRLEDSELEEQLRAAFEPEAETVERVVAAAMKHPKRSPLLLRVAAGSALVAALLVLFMLMRPRSEVRAESLRLEYVGDVALFESPDGSSWVVTPDAANQGSRPHLNLVVVEGEEP